MHELLNLRTGEFEPAQLSRVEDSDIACYREFWRPIFDAKVDDLRQSNSYNRESLAELHLQDAGWDWPERFAEREGQLAWKSFALRCAGRTQGLMFVDLLRRSRLQGQQNQHLVYIDILATAPWNRGRLVDVPSYRGVGVVMVTEAILLSQEESFEGRIGLHSLPQADGFYSRTCSMIDLGPCDMKGGMHYFEIDPRGASAWLSGGRGAR